MDGAMNFRMTNQPLEKDLPFKVSATNICLKPMKKLAQGIRDT